MIPDWGVNAYLASPADAGNITCRNASSSFVVVRLASGAPKVYGLARFRNDHRAPH